MVIRGSFICCKYADLKLIYGFEPRKEAWVGPEWSDEYKTYCYRGLKDWVNLEICLCLCFHIKLIEYLVHNLYHI